MMAGLIGMVWQGAFKREEYVLFMQTGGMQSLFATPEVVLGKVPVTDVSCC